MKVGDTINWMGLRVVVTKVINHDHYFVELGPEGKRYEVEVDKTKRSNRQESKDKLPGW